MTVLNPKGKWSDEKTIINEAKKYSSKSEWQDKSVGSYEAAKRLGIFEKASKHMKRPKTIIKWTKQAILKDAQKYKYRTEWQRNSYGAWEASKKMNLYSEATKHMPKRKKLA